MICGTELIPIFLPICFFLLSYNFDIHMKNATKYFGYLYPIFIWQVLTFNDSIITWGWTVDLIATMFMYFFQGSYLFSQISENIYSDKAPEEAEIIIQVITSLVMTVSWGPIINKWIHTHCFLDGFMDTSTLLGLIVVVLITIYWIQIIDYLISRLPFDIYWAIAIVVLSFINLTYGLTLLNIYKFHRAYKNLPVKS